MQRSLSPQRWQRIGKRAAAAAGIVALACLLVATIFHFMTRILPPTIPAAMAASVDSTVSDLDGHVHYGDNFITRDRGIWAIHVEGNPYRIGFALGKLTNHLVAEIEDEMFTEMNRYIPSAIARRLVSWGVRFRYRHLGDHLPEARAYELAGQADSLFDRHADFLPLYHRLVFYHALHDITQSLENSPMLGCSAFAASRGATTSGHLIIGRNFDFEGPEVFDRQKAITFFKPEHRIAFASVAWGSMSGVVTGLNMEHVFISINAARSDDKGTEGVPVEFIVREVMESAHNLDEAIAIVSSLPAMVPDFYLIGDGKSGESAVIERTPSRVQVRRGGDLIVLTNHALLPPFANDGENDRLRRYLTSGARYDRMKELTDRAKGSIDPQKALEILRDKRGVGDVPLGLGNRNALDAIIATHSVVVDATDLIVWVGVGPHLTGRFVGFDLRREFGDASRVQPIDLPADPIARTDEYRRWQEASMYLNAARDLTMAHQSSSPAQRALALENVTKATMLYPALVEAQLLRADLLAADKQTAEAKKSYQLFLDAHPPYYKDVERVRGLLNTL